MAAFAWLILLQAASAAEVKEAPLLAAAGAAVRDYKASLPDFLCRQSVQRYLTTNLKARWHALDTITAELSYEKGQEVYGSMSRDGKPIPSEDELIHTGGWTKGEWAAALTNVFHPATRPVFFDAGPYSIKGSQGRKYSFAVLAANSSWWIRFGEKALYAGHTGVVWVDRRSGSVVRLEYETRNLPDDFGIDVATLAVDYGWVAIERRKYLLPVRAASVFCERGRPRCQLNRITFTDYRKFEASSRLVDARIP